MVAAVKDDMMNDQMRNLKKWIYLRFQRCRGGAEAWVECWKRSRSSLEETPHAEGRRKKTKQKTSHCMKTRGFADWEGNKVDGVRMSWGERKWDKQQTHRRCHEMLSWEEASCFLLHSSFHHLWIFLWTWRNCSWKPVSPQRSPRMCARQFSAFCFSYVPTLLRNKYNW